MLTFTLKVGSSTIHNSFLGLTPLLLGKESSEESSKPKVIGGHRHRGGKLKMMVEEEDY
jgi:hypothetical protein